MSNSQTVKRKNLKLLLCQINPIVGDIGYNAQKMKEIIMQHKDKDILIFPEMALVGYPLMDHIHDPIIKERNKQDI